MGAAAVAAGTGEGGLEEGKGERGKRRDEWRSVGRKAGAPILGDGASPPPAAPVCGSLRRGGSRWFW